MAKILVTSKGCYAVDTDGKTQSLEQGSEVTIKDKQAEIFVKAGKAELVTNKEVEEPKVEEPKVAIKKSK